VNQQYMCARTLDIGESTIYVYSYIGYRWINKFSDKFLGNMQSPQSI